MHAGLAAPVASQAALTVSALGATAAMIKAGYTPAAGVTYPTSNLGNALKKKGKLDEAIACCRQAIRLNPKYAAGHSNLGNALKKKGTLDEAIACYREAVRLDSEYAIARNNLGTALNDKGKVDEAIACLRQIKQPDCI